MFLCCVSPGVTIFTTGFGNCVAVDFVNTTKPAATQLPKPIVKIVTPGETQQRNIRRIYWGTGLVLSLLSLSLAVYLIVEIVETFF